MHVFSLGAVPAPGGDCKALAEFGISLQVVPGCIQWFVKGKGTEQKPSCYSVLPLMLHASYCHPVNNGVGRSAEQDKAGGLRAGPAHVQGESDLSPIP